MQEVQWAVQTRRAQHRRKSHAHGQAVPWVRAHRADAAVTPSTCTITQYLSGDFDNVGSCRAVARRFDTMILCIAASSLVHFCRAAATALSTASLIIASLAAYGFGGGRRWFL